MSLTRSSSSETLKPVPGARWTDAIFDRPIPVRETRAKLLVGALPGEGVGPQLIDSAERILRAAATLRGLEVEFVRGGAIGLEAESYHGSALTDEVIEFCKGIFAGGGAILSDPGGGRFVYELRAHFDLFCKISPLKPFPELLRAGRLKPELLEGVDILVVRENCAGVYQGSWSEGRDRDGEYFAEHAFRYTESQARAILDVAAALAARRTGEMTVVLKEGGVPTISRLWQRCAHEAAESAGVSAICLNVDYVAFRMIQDPRAMDLIVAPNLLGDILADLGGALVGSRGLCFSGNYSRDGAGVYQTNHGSAHDLAGRNKANPVGQVLSLAMMLRESFGLGEEADLIEKAVADVWRQGWRTEDLTEEDCRLAGTEEIAALIADAALRRAESPSRK